MKNYTVTIELDCTPRLEALLQNVVGLLQVPAAKSEPEITQETEHIEVAETTTDDTAVEDEKVVQKKEKQQEQAKKPKEITDTEIRSHIKACRERILSDLDGDERTRTHNALTQILRDKVAEFGVDKASELPQEHRAAFVAYVDGLTEVVEPF